MKLPLIFGLLFSLAANTAHAGLYSIEVLPNHPTERFTSWSSINDHGQVAGEAFSAVFQSTKRVVTLNADRTVETVVDNLQQDGLLYRPLINNAGQIVYTNNLRPGVFNDLVRTYRYTPGQGSEELASPNPDLGYLPQGINSHGDVIGHSVMPNGFIQNTVIWREGQAPEVLSAGYRGTMIADDRTIVGGTPIGGFVRRDGQAPILLRYPSGDGWAASINSTGQVLGGYLGHTWLWEPNLQNHIEIPTDGGLLLDDGSVTGATFRGSARNQSLGRWSPDRGFEEITQMLDSDALSHGFDRWGVLDVNQRGEILARAWTEDPNINNEPRFNIILRPHPVPEPGTMIALGAGLAALLRRRRAT